MDDFRGSVSIRGDAKFSGTREVTDHSPSARDEAISNERRAALLAVERLQKRLRHVERTGTIEAVEQADRALSAAVERLFADHAETDEERRETNDALGYLSLGAALTRSDGGIELEPLEREARLDAWETFLRYVFQDGFANPWAAFKNFVAVTRRASPRFLDGMTQTQVAELLGETRAATCAREKRRVEGILEEWGCKGRHLLGGTKTDETRRKLSKAQMGNTNRRNGTSRKPKH